MAAAVALLAFGAGATAAGESSRSDRVRDLPADAPLGIVGNPCCGVEVTRLDPVTLKPTRPSAELGEYHDTYSFSPNGRAIAFGISAAPSGGGGERVGIRIVDARKLAVTGNISTGVFAAAVAWLKPSRLIALLAFSVFPCEAPPCAPPTPFDPDETTVIAVDPATGEVLARQQVPFPCDTAEVRGQALISLAGRRLSIIRSDGSVGTVRLPGPFKRCGEIATPIGDKEAVVVAQGGRVVAEIALASSRLSVHELPGSRTGDVEAVAIGGNRLLLAQRGHRAQPNGVVLVNTQTQSRKTIDPSAGEARVNGRTLLTFDGRPVAAGSGIGVRGYRLDGGRRFQVLRGEHVADLEVTGRFAYALGNRGVAVIDTRSGSVVKRSASPFHGHVLSEPSNPCSPCAPRVAHLGLGFPPSDWRGATSASLPFTFSFFVCVLASPPVGV